MFLLALALLCSTAWLQAQEYPQSPPTGSSQTGSASSPTSAEGCLQGSNGSFTLTDNSGTTYQLKGDTAMLSKHVGHEVQITGSPSKSNAGSSTSETSQGSAQQALTVDKVKHISESCKNMSK
jgi:hypothetical protein